MNADRYAQATLRRSSPTTVLREPGESTARLAEDMTTEREA